MKWRKYACILLAGLLRRQLRLERGNLAAQLCHGLRDVGLLLHLLGGCLGDLERLLGGVLLVLAVRPPPLVRLPCARVDAVLLELFGFLLRFAIGTRSKWTVEHHKHTTRAQAKGHVGKVCVRCGAWV